MNTITDIVKNSKEVGLSSLENIESTSEINQKVIAVCQASPTKFFTARMFAKEIVAEGTSKQFSNALWGLSVNNYRNANPVLYNPQRGYYSWITKDEHKTRSKAVLAKIAKLQKTS